jgi:hypothetical protein
MTGCHARPRRAAWMGFAKRCFRRSARRPVHHALTWQDIARVTMPSYYEN